VLDPHRFLLLAGPILVQLGMLGLIGLLGSISDASFFHPPHWINGLHLAIGVAVIGVAFLGGPRLQAAMVLFPAAIGTAIGLMGLILGGLASVRFGIPELADPSDHLAHLTVGLAAWWAWSNRRRGERE
jgi:hypothetical protein